MENTFSAGAAAVNITPTQSLHLFGYPHVERFSTGVHDPLFASALYLHDGQQAALFISCDIIFISKAMAESARQTIENTTGVPASNILVTATHTHSGPGTVHYLSNEDDPTVPDPDPEYLKQLEDGIVSAAQQAVSSARPAETAMIVADGSGVGTNRRDPEGPADPDVPVLIARDAATEETIGLMFICAMHPTVLHEDSTLISGDFPGLTRQYLQREILHPDCPVICCMGASGNQSPRHVVEANTFAEAERLGTILGKAIADELSNTNYTKENPISVTQEYLQLPLRTLPETHEALQNLNSAQAHFDSLKARKAPSPLIRTAECDLFGAQETLTLARAATSGQINDFAHACLPIEVQLIRLGPWCFVGWPGEIFVEFALQIRTICPYTYVITLSNGELQGYLVTEEAVKEGGYEASNALFQSPESGEILLKTTQILIEQASS